MYRRHTSAFVILLLTVLSITQVFCDSLLSDFLSLDESVASSISKKCANESQDLNEAIKQQKLWALKVEDASGRKPIEYYWGNNYFLGSEVACEILNGRNEIYLAPRNDRFLNVSALNVKSEFPLEYRVIFLSAKSSLQFNVDFMNKSIIHIGLCLPKSCSDSDLETLSNHIIAKSFSNKDEIFGDVKFMNSKRLRLRENYWNDPFVFSFA